MTKPATSPLCGNRSASLQKQFTQEKSSSTRNYSPPANESGSRGLAPWQVQDGVLMGFGAKP
ncbi:MAG: hypothetical protein HQL63_09530 [Magnetococcales bacterium]|nr:hypothetical protein [Magnetococcales bacterium]MBF0321358.1 hypothetical protein [Magnetococcales bacterium]